MFVIVSPVCALAARTVWWVLAYHPRPALKRFSAARRTLLVGSTLLPLAWFLSASLRQATTERAAALITGE